MLRHSMAIESIASETKEVPEVKVKIEPDLLMKFDNLYDSINSAIKNGRSGDNTLDNCGNVTHYIIKTIEAILEGKEIPSEKINTDTTASEASYIKESMKPVASIPKKVGLNSMLPPAEITIIDKFGHRAKCLDLNEEKTPREHRAMHYKDIYAALSNAAIFRNMLLYGQVILDSVQDNTPGHVLAYIATPQRVFFIDGHLYNGITKTGNPWFDRFENVFIDSKPAYNFAPLRTKYYTQFQSEVYYLEMGCRNWDYFEPSQIFSFLKSTSSPSSSSSSSQPTQPSKPQFFQAETKSPLSLKRKREIDDDVDTTIRKKPRLSKNCCQKLWEFFRMGESADTAQAHHFIEYFHKNGG